KSLERNIVQVKNRTSIISSFKSVVAKIPDAEHARSYKNSILDYETQLHNIVFMVGAKLADAKSVPT
ncbi:34973_t:CDS:2, partial [Racocetra persica]